MYVCAYLFPGGYRAAHPRGWKGRVNLIRSVGIFSSPRNLSSGHHSRARRVRMEVNGRGRVAEVAVCIYGAVDIWELLQAIAVGLVVSLAVVRVVADMI